MREHLFKYLIALFALFLLTQIVIVPAIGAVEAATQNTNNTSLQTNLTQNSTISLSNNQFNAVTNCVHFDIRIPLPLLDQVSLFNFDLCVPQFLTDLTALYDSTGQTDNADSSAVVMTALGVMIAAIVLLGIVAAVAGYVTGGNSNNVIAGFGATLILGTFIIVLLAGVYPVFSILPLLGFAIWLLTGLVGMALTILTVLEAFSGG